MMNVELAFIVGGFALVLLAAGSLGATAPGDMPRGIRNNNPGNIEYSAANDWQGQTGTDGRYAIFTAPVWGIRAMARILNSYRARGVVTVEQIVTTWAPPNENHSAAYVASVVQRTGWAAGDIVTPDNYPRLLEAIIYHENGIQPYSWAVIEQGVALA